MKSLPSKYNKDEFDPAIEENGLASTKPAEKN